MKKVIDNYNIAYHALAASSFISNCKIVEPDNKKTQDTLYEIELTGINGYSFPHNLASELSSFAKLSTTVKDDKGNKIGEGKLFDGKTEHHLMKDCDGIIFFEKDGQKYMLFCELKSGYSYNEILKAKNQICASYIKMKALMGTLLDFNLQDFVPIGIIFSYNPKSEEKNLNAKAYAKGKSFSEKLRIFKRVDLNKTVNDKAFSPFKMDDITIYHGVVPDKQKCYSIDINTIIP
ncbi:MAG: hypothetical protein IKV67_08290 [Paludibacteraceae bacterium]|nr:hypothetical protein [Paludibacteraceae bacterium]